MGKGQLGIASDEDLVGNVWQYGKLLEVRLPSFIVFLSLFASITTYVLKICHNSGLW